MHNSMVVFFFCCATSTFLMCDQYHKLKKSMNIKNMLFVSNFKADSLTYSTHLGKVMHICVSK